MAEGGGLAKKTKGLEKRKGFLKGGYYVQRKKRFSSSGGFAGSGGALLGLRSAK
jgi:hypothetical protein